MPHNEIIHHNQNGWLLSCYIQREEDPENKNILIGQAQTNEIQNILSDKDNINNIIKNTKIYTENIHSFEKFKNNFIKIMED